MYFLETLPEYNLQISRKNQRHVCGEIWFNNYMKNLLKLIKTDILPFT